MLARTRLLMMLFLTPIFSLAAKGEVLFEGYSKIISGGVHAGYIVTRYEYDAKAKKFYSTYFLKTGNLGSDVTESLKAVADQSLNPISYEYTTIVGKDKKTIDAKFKKGKMTAVVSEGGKTKTVINNIPKGTFLSSFLVYIMLKSEKGLQTDSKYEYQAIAEEDAAVTKGEALVGKEEKYNNIRAFKILNRFKDVKFISYVTDRGEVLATNAPTNGIQTELVAKPTDAIAQFSSNPIVLKALFNDVPMGVNNIVAKTYKEEALKESEPQAGKQFGVPPGENIIIKPGADAGQSSEDKGK